MKLCGNLIPFATWHFYQQFDEHFTTQTVHLCCVHKSNCLILWYSSRKIPCTKEYLGILGPTAQSVSEATLSFTLNKKVIGTEQIHHWENLIRLYAYIFRLFLNIHQIFVWQNIKYIRKTRNILRKKNIKLYNIKSIKIGRDHCFRFDLTACHFVQRIEQEQYRQPYINRHPIKFCVNEKKKFANFREFDARYCIKIVCSAAPQGNASHAHTFRSVYCS